MRCWAALCGLSWWLGQTLPSAGQDGTTKEALTLKRAKALERQLVFAEKGLRAYQTLLATARLSNQERDLAEERIEYLKPLAASGILMIGGQPLKLDELEALQAASEKLVAEALTLAASGPNEQAQKNLEQAHKDDPVSYHADFLLGLYNATVNHDYFLAEAHFKECVQRAKAYRALMGPLGEANFVAALNNWAISKFRADRLDEAIRIWEELVELRPYPAEPIRSNICKAAYYVNLAKANPREWPIESSTSMVKRYESLASRVQGETWQEKRGNPWTLSGYLTEASLSVTSSQPSLGSRMRDDFPSSIVHHGTGIVVQPGHVLTSYNVVMEGSKQAQSVAVVDAAGTVTSAKIVATDFVHRLALLQYAGNEPGIPLASKTDKLPGKLILSGWSQPRATAPAGELNFAQVDSTPASPDPTGAQLPAVFSDFGKFAGTSGSGLVGTDGRLFALAIDGCGSDQELLDDVATADEIQQFLLTQIPQYRVPAAGTVAETNPSATLGSQVVAIRVQLSTSGTGDSNRSSGSGITAILVGMIHDNSCLNCSGVGEIRCRACHKGVQSHQINSVGSIGGGLYPRVEVQHSERVFRACSNCGGDGVVDCPFCDRGEDALRK